MRDRWRGGVLGLVMLVGACAAPAQAPTGGDGRSGKPTASKPTGGSATAVAQGARLQVLGPAPGIVSNNGAKIIANNGSQIVANNGGQLVSNNSGGLVSNNSGGVVANNAGAYVLAQAGAAPAGYVPVANASIQVTDLKGKQLSGARPKTDADGWVRLPVVAGKAVLVRATYKAEGFDQSLSAIIPNPEAGAEVAMDPATTLVTKRFLALAESGQMDISKVPPELPRTMAKSLAPTLNGTMVAAAAVLTTAGASRVFDAAIAADPKLAGATKAAAGDLAATFTQPVPTKGGPVINAPDLVEGPTPPPIKPGTFEPASAMPGQTLTIAGEAFPEGVAVKIGDQDAPIVSATATRLEVKVPEGAADGAVVVSLGGQSVVAAGRLDVVTQRQTFAIGNQPGALAFAPNGDLWATNGDGKMSRLSAGGQNLATVDGAPNPRRVAVTADGFVWVTCAGGKVLKLAPFGATLGTFDKVADPWGLAIDAAGNVWVADRSAGKLTQLAGADGALVRTIDAGKPLPEDLVLDAANELWVSHGDGGAPTRAQVAVTGKFQPVRAAGGAAIAKDGRILIASGTVLGLHLDATTAIWTKEVPAGPGLIAVGDDGDIWLAATGAGKVLRFASDGTLEGTFAFAEGVGGLTIDAGGNVWVSLPQAGKVAMLVP